jgi:hypothetical protein
MAKVVENPRERVVQERLEAVTWPGEALLGFTVCRHNPGEFFDKVYYIGLTERRFLLVRKDQPERVYSIYRCLIDRVTCSGAGLFRSPGFEIQMGGDTLRLETVQPWDQRSVQMVEKHQAGDIEAPYLTATQFLDGVSDLADLGMLRPAQALLRKHMAEDPVLEIEPRAEELDFLLTQGRWSLWLTLIMLGIALVYIAGRVALGAAWAGGGVLPVILLALAGGELVGRQQTWRGLALGFILLAAIFNLAYSGISGSVVDGLVWAAFGLACTISLTGKTVRPRNLAATGIFTLGFLVPLVVSGVVMAATPQVSFQDDFSTDKGWTARDTQTFTSGINNAMYTMHVKEKNAAFLAFPPASFTPTRVQFEARVPEEYQDKVGTYGVTCGREDQGAMYLVEIDPAGKQYAFLKQEGERYAPLGEGYWKPLTGQQAGEGAALVEVQCTDGEMSLTVNGVLQGQTWIAAGEVMQGQARLAGFARDRRMGLFVRTWSESEPRGFEILFDNVVFYNGKAK